MRICVAQTRPVKGDITKNIKNHIKLIELAVSKKANIIVFPELSLIGYEHELARGLATTQDDSKFDILQTLSDNNRIIIGVGIPTLKEKDIFISMIFFQPYSKRITYSKQYLYPTEINLFTNGKEKVIFKYDDKNIIAPAICYELSVKEHAEYAFQSGANIYIASVLNSVSGVDNDIQKLSDIAKKYRMTVLMANFVGQSGGYECAGKSSVWNNQGLLVGQLNNKDEGILMINNNTGQVTNEIL